MNENQESEDLTPAPDGPVRGGEADKPPTRELRLDSAVVGLGVQGVLLIVVGLTLAFLDGSPPRAPMAAAGLLFVVLGGRDLYRAATGQLRPEDRE